MNIIILTILLPIFTYLLAEQTNALVSEKHAQT